MVCAGFHLTGSDDPERCATLGFGDSGGPLGRNPYHYYHPDHNWHYFSYPNIECRIQNMRKQWLEYCNHRRRIQTEAKTESVTAVWGTYIFKFLLRLLLWRIGWIAPGLFKERTNSYRLSLKNWSSVFFAKDASQ